MLFLGIVLAVIGAVVIYFAILLWAGVLSVLPWISFVGFNPLAWPVWLIVIFLLLCTLYFAMGIYLAMNQKNRDVNLYYTTSSPKQKAPRLDALVMSAGWLDEAFMGLSIEPLVFGFLSPLLKERLAPSFRPSAPPKRSGEESSGVYYARFVFHYVLAPVKAVLLWATRWWTEPHVRELILDTASAAGFGLPIQEFSNAVITSKKGLEVPGVIGAGEIWDVTKIFTDTKLTPRSSARDVPLDFLWDNKKLDDILAASANKLKGISKNTPSARPANQIQESL